MRRKKIVGIALGERSLLAAEVVGADKPQVTALGELTYPPDVSVSTPAELGKLLGQLLRDNHFGAKTAVVGLPARWLAVRTKEVPAADKATVLDILRLAAEADFPSDLKDLSIDFAGDAAGGEPRSVLLMGTPRKYVEAAAAVCEAARLSLAGVTSSAVALGEATGRSMSKDALVLAVAPSGSEMTAQNGNAASALRHLRCPTPPLPFVSDLRRALSAVSGGKPGREMILWDGAGIDAVSLGTDLGLSVRSGDLPALGVSTSNGSSNGEGRKYAAAVALGLAGIGQGGPSLDFLHSRLAVKPKARVPMWAVLSAAVVLLVVIGCVYAYNDLQSRRAIVSHGQSVLAGEQDRLKAAKVFVDKVSFAQAWHGGDPRYLACLRDLTLAIPEDYHSYATSLLLHDAPKRMVVGSANSPAALAAAKYNDQHRLTGQLYGKTSDQSRVAYLLDRMQKTASLTDVSLGGSNSGRAGEVAFSINFDFVPQKAAP